LSHTLNQPVISYSLLSYAKAKIIISQGPSKLFVAVVSFVYLIWPEQDFLIKNMQSSTKRNWLLWEFSRHQIWHKNNLNLSANMLLLLKQQSKIIDDFSNYSRIKILLLSFANKTTINPIYTFGTLHCGQQGRF